jgi:hypothetical protein
MSNRVKPNEMGGYQYQFKEDKDAAMNADLITIPVLGTNCGNCMFFRGPKNSHVGSCAHSALNNVPITDRQCCAYWANPMQINSWD